MAIILPGARPLLPCDEHLSERAATMLPPDVMGDLQSAIETLGDLAQAVGRLSLSDTRIPYAGTAVAVGKRAVLVARHAIELMLMRDDGGRPQLDRAREPRLEFVDGEPAEGIARLVFVHPALDVALLETERDLPAYLKMTAQAPSDPAQRLVAAFGFPSKDLRNPTDLITTVVIGGQFHRKHVSIGRTRGLRESSRFSRTAVLTHDCSTLGGFSGGPLVDLATQQVIGIHFAGVYLDVNFAVPSWELALDPRVRIHSISFSHPACPWDDLWEPLILTAPTPPAPVRHGMLTLGPTIQLWERDVLKWERQVDVNPSKAIVDLVVTLFHYVPDIRGWVKYKLTEVDVSDFPEAGSARKLAGELVEHLQRHGLIDRDFFQNLVNDNSLSTPLIRATEHRWFDRKE